MGRQRAETTTEHRYDVLLAVGHDGCDAALAYVVAELRRRGGGVRVAHVILPLEHSGEPPLAIRAGELRVIGAEVVGEVARRLEHELPETVVTTAILRGPTARAVASVARGAGRVVLQRRGRARSHLRTLAVTPPGWRPDPELERTVVVGVDDVLASPRLLDAALDEAAARDARLRIVHAWFSGDRSSDDDGVAAGPAPAALARELAPALDRHRDVAAELVVRHGRPADVLVEEAATAGVVLLGRHRASAPWGSRLGSVVRTVLRGSPSPVLVLDAQICSGSIEMAPAGHSAAQMPQPLQ